MKNVAILGSTGSIGTQTLDVIRRNPTRFRAYALTANRNVNLLIEQAREFQPEVVCIADETLYQPLKAALKDLPIKVLAGEQEVAEVAAMPLVEMVVAAIVGYAGLYPTLEAVRTGKIVALANKETMVVAGELVRKAAKENNARIYPVDSEHSAIFQSLIGEHSSEVEKILLTASGGPFRNTPMEELKTVTAAQALRHPNWQMGAKITIDSATMMNKGFEVIEARWLFDIPAEKIEVVVHPESIVHSAVQFCDGSIKAQLGMPDMRLPIQFALTYPWRLKTEYPRVNLFDLQHLTFEKPDTKRFPCLDLAYEALRRGGNIPCVLNAANEVVVQAFLDGKVGFTDIPKKIEQVMSQVELIENPTYEDYVASNNSARMIAQQLVN